ncbi:TENA/THI-4/PQQC family protein [Actinomadura pelletieri DSM 43383]|uniref:TENA/THI-4/PQQC family protein n=1 Tax=Actinomadura pelletieri DSM 43383 TaxID=1120940 RepID=A0A495QMP0_9ACTN|nr:transcriptional regulator [Actinomadura pelletieri]RKS74244.1 TENA/THI-4/PQQC family protein [Actinomadura pelletieri DSM 43383]
MTRHSAAQLVARARRELADATVPNRFVDLLESGELPRERLVWLAAEESLIVRSDRRSFALLAARFPEPPAGEFFLGLAQGEGRALELLGDFVGALGESEKNLSTYEPKPFAQAYPAYLAQRAAFGTASEVALAMLANLEEWGAYCSRTALAVQAHHGFSEKDVAFFTFFAQTPPGFEELALDVIAYGLESGDDPEGTVRAARLLHAYEIAFWDVLAADLP